MWELRKGHARPSTLQPRYDSTHGGGGEVKVKETEEVEEEEEGKEEEGAGEESGTMFSLLRIRTSLNDDLRSRNEENEDDKDGPRPDKDPDSRGGGGGGGGGGEGLAMPHCPPLLAPPPLRSVVPMEWYETVETFYDCRPMDDTGVSADDDSVTVKGDASPSTSESIDSSMTSSGDSIARGE